MKKFIFTILISLICVCGFSQNMNYQRSQIPDVTENYDMSEINIDRLADRLKLNDYQIEYLKIAHETMINEISKSAKTHSFIKTRHLDKAIANNIKTMKKVLNDDQFKLYSELLTTTIRNNFNMMLYNTFKDMPRLPRRMDSPPNFRRKNG